MRLQMLLSGVEATVQQAPRQCHWCGSPRVDWWQTVVKPLRDTRVEQVEAQRWRCRACGRTFRVYPTGVSARQGSQRLFGAAVMVYLLGLSYGAVSLALRALGRPLAKTTVSSAVQAAAERVPGVKRSATLGGVQTPPTPRSPTAALGADLTSVRVKGSGCR